MQAFLVFRQVPGGVSLTHLRGGGPGGDATRLSLSPPPRLGEGSLRLGEASFLPAGERLRGEARSLRGAAAGDRDRGRLSRSESPPLPPRAGESPPRRAGGDALRREGGDGMRLGGGGRVAAGERWRGGERAA